MPCAWLTGLHQTIAGTQFGGIGPGLSPRQALTLGLKVDQDAIPPALILELKRERLNLDDPAVTLELLRHNAVLGLTGFLALRANYSRSGFNVRCAIQRWIMPSPLESVIDWTGGKPRFKRRRYH